MSPATPDWRVRDLLAHMVGVTADVVEGRLDGIASDAWTGAQVAARAGAVVDELLEEWEHYGPIFATTLEGLPFSIHGQAMFDAVTHEHDLRNALGAPGARDSDAVALGWRWMVSARTDAGAPAVRFVTDVGVDIAGTGDPVATVEAPRFELVRAVTGRRTLDEISAFGWDPEPKPDLVVAAPMFTPRSESLGE
jgi:uncharacterized protein (TIGR03083 family)